MALKIGHVLQGRYRIEALLGEGGMGAVYRGTDLRFNAPVAIKENKGVTPESQQQFAREAAMLYQLRNPHLPRVIDHFVIQEKGQYLVMDYIEGQDLGQILTGKEPISETQALDWIDQVLDALAYLHARGIIHRDVKPANIKISSQGHVFLVDFGLAKFYDPMQMTTIGARGVTPGFAPPEQYGQGRTDARSDVYSAAATLYALLTRRTPPDALELITGQAHFVHPRQVNLEISPELEQAILQAMRAQPAERFETVAEFRQALQPGQTQIVPPQETQLQARTSHRLARVAWSWKIIGIVLVLVVLGAGSWRLLTTTSRRADDGTPPIQSAGTELLGAIEEQPVPTSVLSQEATPDTAPTVATSSTLLPTVAASSTPAPTATADTAQLAPTGRIAFVSDRGSGIEIRVINADGSRETLLATLTDTLTIEEPLVWSPDGQRIALVASADDTSDIYVLSLDELRGTGDMGLTNLTKSPDEENFPTWSPDGSQIAFESRNGIAPKIYVANSDGSGLIQLTHDASEEQVAFDGDPAWSPDGTTIAFQRLQDMNYNIYVINSDGSGLRNLTNGSGFRTNPAWSPDSTQIAFLAGNLVSDDVYIMRADGSGTTRLTSDRAQIGFLSWSPDEDRIAFQSDRDFDFNIYIAEAKGGGPTLLTSLAGRNVTPSWSPDGTWIAFTSYGESEGDVYVASSDGSTTYRLTYDPARDWLPAWSPK